MMNIDRSKKRNTESFFSIMKRLAHKNLIIVRCAIELGALRIDY